MATARGERLAETRRAGRSLARASLNRRKAALAGFVERRSPRDRPDPFSDPEVLAALEDPLWRICPHDPPDSSGQSIPVRAPAGLVVAHQAASARLCALAVLTGNGLAVTGDARTNILDEARQALTQAGLPEQAIASLDGIPDRELLAMQADVLVTDSSAGFQTPASEETGASGREVCHTYVDGAADLEQAVEVCLEAHLGQPGPSTDTVLVHEAVAERVLPELFAGLEAEGIELAAGEAARRRIPRAGRASAATWDAEHAPASCGVRVVGSIEEALEHVDAHGSRRAEAIVTSEPEAALTFLQAADAAQVLLDTPTTVAASEIGPWGQAPSRLSEDVLAVEDLTRTRRVHLPIEESLELEEAVEEGLASLVHRYAAGKS